MSNSRSSTSSLNVGPVAAPPLATENDGEKKHIENTTPNSSVPPSPISEEGEEQPEQQQQAKSLGDGQDTTSGPAVDGGDSTVDPTKVAYETDDNDKDIASNNPSADFCDACMIM